MACALGNRGRGYVEVSGDGGETGTYTYQLNVTVRPSAFMADYTLKVERVGTDDHPSTLASASGLQVPTSVSGSFEAEDGFPGPWSLKLYPE